MIRPSLRRILVIQTAFLGDVILVTALLEKLHQHYPESDLDLLVRKGYEGIFDNHPFLNDILTFDKNQPKIPEILRSIRTVRKKRYDLVINVQRFAATGIITLFSGADITIGYDKNPLSKFFTIRKKHRFSGIHEVERNHGLIEWMTDAEAARPRIYPGVSAYERVEVLKNIPFICIAPGSVWFTKQFPPAKWAGFAKAIPENLVIYLIGSASDAAIADQILQMSQNRNMRNLCGELDVLETAALMSSAIMNFVNDSAPHHMASAVNAPVCIVYCSTIPDFGFGPLSDVSYIVETDEKLSCRPCGIHGRTRCPQEHFNCAQVIPVEKLITILRAQLSVRGEPE